MGISGINTMQALISAGSAMTRVQRQGSVAANMQGREGVLEAEIKLDSARGGNVEKKQEELEDVQKKLTQVQSTQMNTLADANKRLEEAAKADAKVEAEAKKKSDKKEEVEAKKEAAEKKKETTEAKKNDKVDMVSGAEETEFSNVEVVTENVVVGIPETTNVSVQGATVYPHVDVRL